MPEAASTYEARGEYQMIVEVLEPVGLGALQLAFDQLKEKLQKEGLFNPERKRPIPALPRKIGIVTSRTGAALRDILTVLKRRHNAVNVLIFPCEVQGAGASLQIMEGIDYLSRYSDVDVIVVARGGGSMEDLWPFNEERVAGHREVAETSDHGNWTRGGLYDCETSSRTGALQRPARRRNRQPVKEELFRRVQDFSGRLQGSIRYRLRTMRHFLDSRVGSWICCCRKLN